MSASSGSNPRDAAAAPPRRLPPLPSPPPPGPPLPAFVDAQRLASLPQGSAAWIAARVGRVTASRVADVVVRTRTGFGAARGAYLTELLAERLSGRPAEPYLSPAMAWGRRHESGARAAYEFFRSVDVVACGLLTHPSIAMAGASPDGLVGDDGLLEIKCPTTATHLDVVLKAAIPERHQIQMQWQMACSGRNWCDYLTYDPRLPEPTRLAILRLMRDDARIGVLEDEVRAFLEELDAREALLRGAALPLAAATPSGPRRGAHPEAPPSVAVPTPARDLPSSSGARQPPQTKDPAHLEQTQREDVETTPRQIVDVSTTRRKPLSPRQRLALYEAHGGVCCICGNRIVGGRWVDEHIRPLSLGGSNGLDNRGPAHERCAQEKTRDDLCRLAKAKAQKRAHLGLKAATRVIASRSFPASDRVRPNLSPLGPPRAGRLLAEREETPSKPPDEG